MDFKVGDRVSVVGGETELSSGDESPHNSGKRRRYGGAIGTVHKVKYSDYTAIIRKDEKEEEHYLKDLHPVPKDGQYYKGVADGKEVSGTVEIIREEPVLLVLVTEPDWCRGQRVLFPPRMLRNLSRGRVLRRDLGLAASPFPHIPEEEGSGDSEFKQFNRVFIF